MAEQQKTMIVKGPDGKGGLRDYPFAVGTPPEAMEEYFHEIVEGKTQPPPLTPPNLKDRFLQPIADSLNPLKVLGGVAGTMKAITDKNTYPAIYQDTKQHLSNARQNFNAGHIGDAVDQGLRSIPVLGGMYGGFSDKVGAGDYAGAAGDSTALLLSAILPETFGLAGELGRATKPLRPMFNAMDAGTGALKEAFGAIPRKLVDQGIKLTPTMREEFPGALQAILDERVGPPTVGNVRSKLTDINESMKAVIRGYDNARPNVAGYLGPGTDTVELLTGTPPMGKRAISADPMGSVIDVGRSPAIPNTSAFPSQVEIQNSNLGWIDDRHPNHYQPRPPQFLGEQAGPESGFSRYGVLRQEMPHVGPELGRADYAAGGPPTMINPFDVIAQAKEHVMKKGKMEARGHTKEADMAKLDELVDAYKRTNYKPKSLEEGLDQKIISGNLAAWGESPTRVDELLHEGTAIAQRDQLGDRIPSIKPDLEREQNLLGALAGAKNYDRSTRSMFGLHPFSGAGSAGIGYMFGGTEGAMAGALLNEALRTPSGAYYAARFTQGLGNTATNPNLYRALMLNSQTQKR